MFIYIYIYIYIYTYTHTHPYIYNVYTSLGPRGRPAQLRRGPAGPRAEAPYRTSITQF